MRSHSEQLNNKPAEIQTPSRQFVSMENVAVAENAEQQCWLSQISFAVQYKNPAISDTSWSF